MNLQLPSLIMLNLDWTCVTEASSLEYLQENGKFTHEIYKYGISCRVIYLMNYHFMYIISLPDYTLHSSILPQAVHCWRPSGIGISANHGQEKPVGEQQMTRVMLICTSCMV